MSTHPQYVAQAQQPLLRKVLRAYSTCGCMLQAGQCDVCLAAVARYERHLELDYDLAQAAIAGS